MRPNPDKSLNTKLRGDGLKRSGRVIYKDFDQSQFEFNPIHAVRGFQRKWDNDFSDLILARFKSPSYILAHIPYLFVELYIA